MKKIRLVIADDHEVVRQGLRRIVEEQEDLTVVGEASDGFLVLETVEATSPDLLLLDVTMPGPGVENLIQDVKGRHPRVGLLVLSIHPEEQIGLSVLRAGADGYLNKGRSADELVSAVRRIHAGEVYLSSTMARMLTSHLREPSEHAGLAELTDREVQVLSLLGGGLTVQDIARKLDLSPKTVASHRSRIREKLGITSNGALVRYAVERGLVA